MSCKFMYLNFIKDQYSYSYERRYTIRNKLLSNRLALSRRCSSLIPGELACLYMYPLSVLSQGSCISPIECTAWYIAGLREKIANATKFNNPIL